MFCGAGRWIEFWEKGGLPLYCRATIFSYLELWIVCDVKFPKPHETQRQTLILSFSIAFILPNAAFVNHALAGLYPSLPTTGLKICPSPFLHHDSYTLPALLDCLQLLLTNSSLVDSLLSLFKLLPWFRDKSASVHSTVWRKVNPQGAAPAALHWQIQDVFGI